MSNQFTTLTKSYYDNFLEYKLTGNESNRKAYMSAEEGIESLLTQARGRLGVQSDQINNFYNTDIQNKIRTMKSDISSTQKNILRTKDNLTAAEMRQTPRNLVIETTAPIPTSYLVGTGILLVIGALLTAL